MNKGEKILSERVAEEIIDMITIEKRFAPGDKLPNENILSQELGVSRTTLREAVRYLAAHNILEIKRGKGTFVTEHNEVFDDLGIHELENVFVKLKDVLEMRLIFEPYMVYLAVKRGTEEEINKIIEYGMINDEIVSNGGDRTETDKLFHGAIAKASHNNLVKSLLPILEEGINIAEEASEKKVSVLNCPKKDHLLIIECIKNKDAVGAKYAMYQHIANAMREFGYKVDME